MTLWRKEEYDEHPRELVTRSCVRVTWSDHRTRRLLRKVRVPGKLDVDETAIALHQRAASAVARDAVLEVVEASLRPYDAVYASIIQLVDIQGASISSAADRLHLTPRTLHRYRGVAIAAIGRAIDARLDGMPRGNHEATSFEGLESLGRAQNFLRRRTAGALFRARRCFRETAERDPRSARAWLGLAQADKLLGEVLQRDPRTSFAEAEFALGRATASNPGLPEARALHADLLLFAHRDLTYARSELYAGLAMDADSALVRDTAAWFALGDGDITAAVDHARHGIAAHPAALELRTTYGVTQLALGNFATAKHWLQGVLDVEPDHYVARHYMCHALVGAGALEACTQHIATIVPRERSVMVEAIDRHVDGLSGRRSRVHRYLSRTHPDGNEGPRVRYARALAYAGLGAHDEAIAELEAAVRGQELFVWTILWDPLFHAIRCEPRFQALVERARRPSKMTI